MKNNRVHNRLTKKADTSIKLPSWLSQINEIQDSIQELYNEIGDTFDEAQSSNEENFLNTLINELNEMTRHKDKFVEVLEND